MRFGLIVFLVLVPFFSIAKKIMNKILLGSGSSTRKAICTELGFKYEIIKADIDERAIGDRSSSDSNSSMKKKATELVLLLANKKADAIIEKLNINQKNITKTTTATTSSSSSSSNNNIEDNIDKNIFSHILLTADQVVVHDNNILEKPINEIEARNFINGYSELPCSTVGSCV